MADEKDIKSELSQVTEIFFQHQVEFIVIGGQAETLMGSPRVTYDVDVCYRRTPENMQRLAAALNDLNAKLRNVPDDVVFILDERSLKMGSNFTFKTSIIDVDVLGYVEPIGDFEAVLKNSESFELSNGRPVRTIGLDDLILVKTTIKRFKDSESMYQLLAIKRLRDQTRQR